MPKRASESDSGRPSPSWGDKLIDFSLKYAEQKPFEKVTTGNLPGEKQI